MVKAKRREEKRREEKRLLCRGIKKRRGEMRKNERHTHIGILLGVMIAMLISVIPIISMSAEIESETILTDPYTDKFNDAVIDAQWGQIVKYEDNAITVTRTEERDSLFLTIHDNASIHNRYKTYVTLPEDFRGQVDSFGIEFTINQFSLYDNDGYPYDYYNTGVVIQFGPEDNYILIYRDNADIQTYNIKYVSVGGYSIITRGITTNAFRIKVKRVSGITTIYIYNVSNQLIASKQISYDISNVDTLGIGANFSGTTGYFDASADIVIANDKFWVNKDYADWTVTKPLRLYWYYDNDFTVNVTDNISGEQVEGVNIEFTNEGDYEGKFVTDEDGNAYVNDMYTELSSFMFLYFNSEEYLPFRTFIQVNSFEMSYTGTTKVQILKNAMFNELVKDLDTYEPLFGVEVRYGNGYFNCTGYTDEIGVYRSILNVDRTNPIVVTLSKPMYKTMSYSIKPDIWTSRPVTFQESNQRNILNVPNTSILNMIYEINDTIVYGESSDFGDNWVMERVGTGRNPVFVQTSGGIVAVWNDKEVEFNYAVKASPWTPEDSLTPSICWYSEMALAKHPSTDAVYGAFINNYDEDEYGGDLMFVNWNGTDVENAELQLVKEYDYTEATSPKYSPVITNYFNKSLLLVVPSTGWISINSDFRVMNKVNNIWQEIINGYPINLSGQLCSNPTADYKLNKTTFVWQVEEDLGTSIWKREISSGTVNEPVQISSVEGMNTNARYDGGKIFAYINEECNLVDKNNTIIYESGEDKIYSMELVTKPLLTKDIVYYTWVENEGMEYLIKGMTKYYSDIAQPDFATMPTDTQTSITSSPIYEYLPKKEPVERLSYTLVGMEPEMYYEVKVVTSEGSPVKPQIIQIDGEVYGVVIGHANSVDTTVIEVPKAVYADGEITVSIDRKKGNPNRIAEILVNEYEQENDLVAVSNVIMPFKKDFGKELNETETSIKYLDKKLVFNISSDENCIKEYKVIDVTGRTVEKKTLNLKNGLNRIEVPVNIKNGIYFIKVGGVDSSYKVTVLK